MADTIDLTLRIKRFNPEVRPDPWWDEFQITAEPDGPAPRRPAPR